MKKFDNSELCLKPINDNEKINWFPGHMHKSMNYIEKIKSNIDLIIEIKDARAKIASDNTELSQIFSNKPILKIYLKKDLSNFNNKIDDITICAFDKNIRNLIINKIEKMLETKLIKLKNKGLLNPIIQVLVCGLPNLGKSTIINKLVQKNVAQTADSPGWTKKFTKYKFYKNMWVYDTPGIFYKTVEKNEIGYQLALIGAIKREVIPIEKTLEYAYNYLKKHYMNLLMNLITKDLTLLDFNNFVFELCKKNNFLQKNNDYDIDKGLWFFYDLIRSGKIGLISWD